MILDNLTEINAKIEQVCQSCDRKVDDIIVIGVTKYSSVDQINEALAAGVTHIAENRVQDASEKFPLLVSDNSITKYLIGHLQTNKAKLAVELFDMIQSVDSVKLVKEINKRAHVMDKVMDVLIQVNVAGEDQKFGCEPEELKSILDECVGLASIRVQGLMTMAPFTDDELIVRPCFQGLKKLYDQMALEYASADNIDMKYLSMGMSGDYLMAIEEGANMVRIGSAIFK